VKGSTPQALDAEADELAATDPGLVSMKMSLNQRRAVLIAQMANLTPNHPQYKQDAAELAQIDSSLDTMMKDLRGKVSARIEQRLHTDLDRTTAVQDRLNGQLSQLAAAAGGATPQMQRAADLATNISRLQNRFAVLDEQVRNLTLQANAPGSAYFSAVATIPIHLAWALILKKATMYALGGIILALGAALIANNMDQRIYVAADVTAVLGFAPMAQLPDFREVSPGIAEDHMLRLSAAIEHACRQGNLKNCIFTAISTGAGTTTIATRVRSMLESMGRSAVLVDASGAGAQQAQGAGQNKGNSTALVTSDRASRTNSLMQQLTEEAEEGVESLVLTDTAPLAISAETEYLARYVDAAIVVLEAGVTTRAQLRAAAETLTRLDVAAVGFVLNKVKLKTADLPFRNTVRAMEQHQGIQNRMAPRLKAQAQAASAEIGAGRATASLDRGSSRGSARELPQGAAAAAVPVASSGPVSTPAATSVSPLARARAERDQAAAVSPAPATSPGASEQGMPQRPTMSPNLREAEATRARAAAAAASATAAPAAAPTSTAAPAAPSRKPDSEAQQAGLPRRPAQDPTQARLQEWEDFAAMAGSKPEAARLVENENRPGRAPVRAPGVDTQASQLGSLRDHSFAEALKNLPRQASGQVHPPTMVDLPPSNLEVEKAPGEPRARFDEPLVQGKRPAAGAARPGVPQPANARSAVLPAVTAQPEFLPPKPAAESEGKTVKKGSNVMRREHHDTIDDVEILPSWRGQYKKR
jgi:hypothetical protein